MEILNTLFKTPQPAAGGAVQNSRAVAGEAAAATPGGAAGQTEAAGILEELKAQGYALSAEETERITEFVETTEGTREEKLQAVKSALDKGLPITLRSLEAVRTALFAPALPPEILRLAETGAVLSQERAAVLNALSQLVQQEAAVQEAVRVGAGGTLADSGEALAALLQGAEAPGSGESLPEEGLQWLLKAAAQLASLAEALEEAEPAAAEAALPRDAAGGRSLTPAKAGLREASEETAQREPAQDPRPEALPRKGEDLRSSETPPAPEAEPSAEARLTQAAQKLETGDMEAALQAAYQGITLLVREITPRIQAVRQEFEVVRRALRTELQQAQEALAPDGAPDRAKAAEALDKAIDRLDRTLLRSDIPLYTSMKTEKQLLTWSSELQEARRLVQEGQSGAAARIVSRVETGLAEIRFEPAKLKIIHRALETTADTGGFREQALHQRLQQQLNRVLTPAQTPREVLEAFKALGLTHESEVVSALGQGAKKQQQDWRPPENLKEVLMKLAADTQEKLTTVTAAEKTLSGMTGQQLLNRPEPKQQQTLVFSLPMALADRVEDLKVYVQSRKEQGKVDWENCTFYFAVHTEKYGDVGIRLAAVRKSVAIQVKCDDETLREAIRPLVEDFKTTMAETGYRIAGVSYSPLADQKAARTEAAEPAAPAPEEGGLNLRV